MALRSGLKVQVHAMLAKQGVRVAVSDLFGVVGRALLGDLPLDPPYAARVASLRRLIEAFDFEIDVVSARLRAQLTGDPGYQAVQAIPGVGPVLAGVLVAEDRRRHPVRPAAAAVLLGRAHPSAPGVRHHRPPRVHHKAGQPVGALGGDRGGAAHAPGRRVAGRHPGPAGRAPRPQHRPARRLLTLVYYGLRDGHVRALDTGRREAA